MASTHYNNVGIQAVSVAVPAQVYNNYTDNDHFNTDEAAKIADSTGIKQRRVADENTCASDLAMAAAEKALADTGTNRSSIDFLIFVSQTPDYKMPATGIILQHRLGLSKSCAAFDVNLGCSGFVYGLNLAYALGVQPGVNKVMLVNAETRTKAYSFKDRQTGFLFGDAASALIIEKGEHYGPSWFLMDSDGSRYDYIMIKSGGYRHPSTPESLLERTFEDGSIRNDEQAVMNGLGVFEFVITQVPAHVKKILSTAELSKDDVDWFVFHQANQAMNNYLIKKLKLNSDKVPSNLDRFGNTSSVSIPLTISTELRDRLSEDTKVVISGFGVGLSIGSALITMNSPLISRPVEV
ncbi:ketoacyl-ACP synthase III [Desulfonatronovibrio magnus]|uniref:ketoacyl-ACP synthase III n=1 Tax=Desulfonatronovibrio magnus TaxID=698827 RepID=UPI0005EBE921|nr:ketoacyl-ACP synthase III [Desulfonatronovibrio magnus]